MPSDEVGPHSHGPNSEQSPSTWTTETLRIHFEHIIQSEHVHWDTFLRNVQDRVQIAVEAQSRFMEENEKRYEQRFTAHEIARESALSSAERLRIESHAADLDREAVTLKNIELQIKALSTEFHEHLLSAREEMKTALDSADKAIMKSEVATQKAIDKTEASIETRFQSVNEFRAQLADQTQTFIPRREAEQRVAQVDDKLALFSASMISQINGFSQRMDGHINTINSRLDLTQGSTSGLEKGWGYIIGAVGLAATVIAIILAFNN